MEQALVPVYERNALSGIFAGYEGVAVVKNDAQIRQSDLVADGEGLGRGGHILVYVRIRGLVLDGDVHIRAMRGDLAQAVDEIAVAKRVIVLKRVVVTVVCKPEHDVDAADLAAEVHGRLAFFYELAPQRRITACQRALCVTRL